MIHFCIFGGHNGQLVADQAVYFTMFGGCELKQPTIAKRMIEIRRLQSAGLPTQRRNFFITIFGGTEITLPTLSEEFLDLQEAIRSGLLTLEQWNAAAAQMSNESVGYGSFTFMGGFESASLPKEEEEVDGLAINRHLGHISDSAGKTLELGIGRSGSSRSAVLRQALGTGAPLASPAT